MPGDCHDCCRCVVIRDVNNQSYGNQNCWMVPGNAIKTRRVNGKRKTFSVRFRVVRRLAGTPQPSPTITSFDNCSARGGRRDGSTSGSRIHGNNNVCYCYSVRENCDARTRRNKRKRSACTHHRRVQRPGIACGSCFFHRVINAAPSCRRPTVRFGKSLLITVLKQVRSSFEPRQYLFHVYRFFSSY